MHQLRRICIPIFLCVTLCAPACAQEEVQGAVVYWQAQIGGLYDALAGQHVTERTSPWDVGFQLSWGHRFGHDQWKLSLAGTCFQTHANGHATSDLAPVGSLPQASLFDSMESHWRLHLGLLDLLLEKSYAVSPSLSLTPYMALRFGSMRQKHHSEWIGAHIERLRTKNKFWGIGPALGLNSEWSLWSHLGFFAHAYVGTLYGEFYLHQDESDNGVRLLGVHSTFRSIVPFLEGSLGLQWKASSRWNIEVGWDQRIFFAQNQWLHFLSPSQQGVFAQNQGDLTLSGIHAQASYWF